jgi:hypothetical protein
MGRHISHLTVSRGKARINQRLEVRPTMQEATNDEMAIRERLKAKRNRLLKEFFENPVNTRLAIKIRLIDDRVAEITEHQQTRQSRADT